MPSPTRSFLVLALSMLACSPEPEPASSSRTADAPRSAPANPPPATPSAIDLPPVEPRSEELVEELEDPVEPTEPEPTPPTEPADPLAPILPEGPEPGSPEADAELVALLDESTLTQDEFDKAFRGGGGPNIQGDEFVFGAGERSRATPVIEIGKPRVEVGSVSVADFEAIVRADERKLLGCHAVALTEHPTSKGGVELRLRFDAGGSKVTVTAEGGDALAPSLVACLIAVAESWRPKSAGGAKLAVPLKLSTQ